MAKKAVVCSKNSLLPENHASWKFFQLFPPNVFAQSYGGMSCAQNELYLAQFWKCPFLQHNNICRHTILPTLITSPIRATTVRKCLFRVAISTLFTMTSNLTTKLLGKNIGFRGGFEPRPPQIKQNGRAHLFSDRLASAISRPRRAIDWQISSTVARPKEFVTNGKMLEKIVKNC